MNYWEYDGHKQWELLRAWVTDIKHIIEQYVHVYVYVRACTGVPAFRLL
jgi:hypothetical protein